MSRKQTARKHFVNCVGYPYLTTSGQISHATLAKGDQVELEREPKNPYDKNAIKVLDADTGEKIGFVDRSSARDLAPLIDRGIAYQALVERPVVLEHGETIHPMMLRILEVRR